jgi:hypothetical protein
MPMRKSFVLAAALAFAVIPAFAADHLEPESSAFNTREELWDLNYNDMVLTQFKDLFDSDVVARMIGEPSFRPEYGVGLAHGKDGWRVIAVESASYLWSYEVMDKNELHDSKLPADWHANAVRRSAQSLDPALAARIANLWNRMLYDTRYAGLPPRFTADGLTHDDDVIIGADGETFHFSGGSVSGKTWSPSDKAPPGMLVDLALAMIAYCQHKSTKTLAAIEQAAAVLEQRLSESP